MNPERSAVRYHGGKWMLAPWIISHFPEHRIYVEPFGGGASVLLRKRRTFAEIYNDMDGEIVNLFRVLRDHGDELIRAITLTPFSRVEFENSYAPSDDPVEQARRTILRSFQGFGSAAVCGEVSGFRANSQRSGTTPAHAWYNYPEKMPAMIDRLRGVVIENRPAIDVMRNSDAPNALHYVDPPYVHSTRSGKVRGTDSRKSYKFEMTDSDHVEFAAALHGLSGHVVLSGYPSALYSELYADWLCIERKANADGARPRMECLWLNPRCAEAQRQQRLIA